MRRLCLDCYKERRRHSHRRVAQACAWCGREFMAQQDKRRPNKYCSIKCGRHGDRKLVPCPRCGATFWPWAKGRHPRKFCCKAIRKQYIPRPPVARLCAFCGCEFLARGIRIYCSARCQKQAYNQRHYLRRRGMRWKQNPIPLAEIYKRDAGICGLCRQRVSRRFKPNHPRSATIDHIVPISKGGPHVRSNVQLAHYGCNSAKRDRPLGQLRLI